MNASRWTLMRVIFGICAFMPEKDAALSLIFRTSVCSYCSHQDDIVFVLHRAAHKRQLNILQWLLSKGGKELVMAADAVRTMHIYPMQRLFSSKSMIPVEIVGWRDRTSSSLRTTRIGIGPFTQRVKGKQRHTTPGIQNPDLSRMQIER